MIDDYAEHEDVDVEESAPPEDRPTRGLLWVLGPTAFGALLGTGVGNALRLPRPMAETWWSDGLIGAASGGILGLLIWVCFPYKK